MNNIKFRLCMSTITCLAVLLVSAIVIVGAEETDMSTQITNPLWEVGVFAGGAYIPYYKGSDENRSFAFLLPYVVYRGDVINLDEDSLTGRFLKTEFAELDFSISGEVNKNDDARIVMPELDPLMFAVGPALKIFFKRKAKAGYDLYLSLPFRAAISADFDDTIDTSYQGLQGKVNLFYANNELLPDKKCEFVAAIGVGFMDSELAGYYYDVDDHYVQAGRPAYRSGGGYSGLSGTLDVMYHATDNFSVRFYTSVDFLDGAVFEDSPLVAQSVNVSAGVVFIFSLWESKRRVPRE